MTRFRAVGLRVSSLIVSLSSLGLTIVSPNTLAVNTRPPLDHDSVATVTETIDSTDLDGGVVESEIPVPIVEGEGGDFAYQIWQNTQVSDYYLFIWNSEFSPSQDAAELRVPSAINDESIAKPIVSYNFDSAAEAVNFFTCRYARERIDSCVMVMSSVSYDVPETCAFPWVDCKEP